MSHFKPLLGHFKALLSHFRPPQATQNVRPEGGKDGVFVSFVVPKKAAPQNPENDENGGCHSGMPHGLEKPGLVFFPEFCQGLPHIGPAAKEVRPTYLD